MSGSVVRNFRGARALVCHADDGSRAALAKTLARLGLEVTFHDPGLPDPKPAADAYDVIFFDADARFEDASSDPPGVPLIALIGVETPSQLARVVRRCATGYIVKPLRSSGIYTALVVAFAEDARRKAEAQERAVLVRRVNSRRHMIKAILLIMKRNGVDDEAAFQALRREAMRRRLPIEDVAQQILCEADDSLQTVPQTFNAKRM